MNKVINIHKSIYEISKETPEIVEIMYELGFKDIKNPAMLNTAGRLMSIEKGARMKGLDLTEIKTTLADKGYTIEE